MAPTPVLLPRESHGQRSLVGYSPWGLKDSDMTERLHLPTHSPFEHSTLFPKFLWKLWPFWHLLLYKVGTDSTQVDLSQKRSCCCWCLVAPSCLTLYNPMNCNPPDSSVHGISQARILEWVAISFSRESSHPQGSNSHLLYWQGDSLPLSHLGSPEKRSLLKQKVLISLKKFLEERRGTRRCLGVL